MMRTIIFALAAGLTVAACGSEPAVNEKNASVAEVAAKVRAATNGGQFIRAGEWRSTTTIEEMAIPGMPASEAARMKQVLAQAENHQTTTCLTEDDVKQPTGKMLTGKNACRYDHFTMRDGKIDAAMRCSGPGGTSQVMTMKGTYAPERYSMQMAMEGDQGDGSPSGMKMRMRVESERIGECTAKTAETAP